MLLSTFFSGFKVVLRRNRSCGGIIFMKQGEGTLAKRRTRLARAQETVHSGLSVTHRSLQENLQVEHTAYNAVVKLIHLS